MQNNCLCRFLATGDSQQTISFNYRVGRSTVSSVVTNTCQAICQVLRFEPPRTVNKWLKISHDFEEFWNFPHCLGSIDGKHIAIQAFPKSGLKYYNYKKFHSILLMAVSDAKYKFTIIDIGDFGSHSGGGVFGNSCFGRALNENQFSLPPPSPIINVNESLPHCFVGDEAFPLKTNIMRPYPGHKLPDDKKNFQLSLVPCTKNNLKCIWNFDGTLAHFQTFDKFYY